MAATASALAFSRHSRSTVLHREGGLLYLGAADVSADAIGRLLSECFAREPMSTALGAGARDLRPLIERFIPECTSNGLSAVAVLANDPQTLAGVLLCRDFRSPFPADLSEAFPWFPPLGQALATVGEAYEARHPGQRTGEAVDLWMLGTDKRFTRRGIGKRLFRICVELAREQGFRQCVSECTGSFSQAAAENARFREVARLPYRDFRFEGRPVFATIPAEHPHLAFYELDL